MKRFLLLATTFLLTIMLFSCTKDTSVSLRGTRWVGTTIVDSSSITIDLSFGKSDFTMVYNAIGEKLTMHGNYSYTSPNVKLLPITTIEPNGTVVDQTGIVYNGTVDGSNMTVYMGNVMVNFVMK